MDITGSFSVTPMPAATFLKPGESLDLDVTFDPRNSVPLSGILVVDADAAGFVGRFDLTGIGQRTAAQISLDSFNNNVGGLNVGQQRLPSA